MLAAPSYYCQLFISICCFDLLHASPAVTSLLRPNFCVLYCLRWFEHALASATCRIIKQSMPLRLSLMISTSTVLSGSLKETSCQFGCEGCRCNHPFTDHASWLLKMNAQLSQTSIGHFAFFLRAHPVTDNSSPLVSQSSLVLSRIIFLD